MVALTFQLMTLNLQISNLLGNVIIVKFSSDNLCLCLFVSKKKYESVPNMDALNKSKKWCESPLAHRLTWQVTSNANKRGYVHDHKKKAAREMKLVFDVWK